MYALFGGTRDQFSSVQKARQTPSVRTQCLIRESGYGRFFRLGLAHTEEFWLRFSFPALLLKPTVHRQAGEPVRACR